MTDKKPTEPIPFVAINEHEYILKDKYRDLQKRCEELERENLELNKYNETLRLQLRESVDPRRYKNDVRMLEAKNDNLMKLVMDKKMIETAPVIFVKPDEKLTQRITALRAALTGALKFMINLKAPELTKPIEDEIENVLQKDGSE